MSRANLRFAGAAAGLVAIACLLFFLWNEEAPPSRKAPTPEVSDPAVDLRYHWPRGHWYRYAFEYTDSQRLSFFSTLADRRQAQTLNTRSDIRMHVELRSYGASEGVYTLAVSFPKAFENQVTVDGKAALPEIQKLKVDLEGWRAVVQVDRPELAPLVGQPAGPAAGDLTAPVDASGARVVTGPAGPAAAVVPA